MRLHLPLKVSALLMSSLVALGVVYLLIEPRDAAFYAGRYNYWILAAIFAAFIASLWRVRAEFRITLELLKRHRLGLLVIILVGIFWQLHEPHRFKILFDEHTFSGVAHQMHFERSANAPARAHYVDGSLDVLDTFVDKRPAFYPFILSLLHDVSGYRVENVFALNAALGLLLAGLVYAWGVALGSPQAGMAGVLLLGSLPLMAQNATGGGYELLNLSLITGLLLSGRAYLNKGRNCDLNLLVVIGLMLACTRYESILYLLALGVIVLIRWIRQRQIHLTWFAALSPLALVSPLLSNRVFFASEAFFQTEKGNFFSLEHLIPNLEIAAYYLFSPPQASLGNSLLLSLAGALCLVAFIVRSLSRAGQWRSWPSAQSVILPVLGVAMATTMLALSNFWGQWNDPAATRFSLPLQLMMCLAVMAVLVWMHGDRPIRSWIPVLLGAYLILFTAPVTSRHEATDSLIASVETDWFSTWAAEHVTRTDLIVSESAILYILHGWAATPFKSVERHPQRLIEVLDAGLYENVYTFERYLVAPGLGVETPAYTSNLPLQVLTEVVAQTRLRTNVIARISRVTGYNPELEPQPLQQTPQTDSPSSRIEQLLWNYSKLP